MKILHFPSGLIHAVYFLSFCLFFIQCKPTTQETGQAKSDKTEKPTSSPMLPLIKEKVSTLDSLFALAMIDAQNPDPSEIYRGLTVIEGNNNLIDTTINDEKHILMVSWKLNPKYYPKTGKYETGEYDIWVTAAPFIKDSCEHYYRTLKDPIKVNMRLRQLLGLQPFSVETFFLEVWVRPDDLFRPCPDNETDDTYCGLSLPETVTKEYRRWFNHLRAVQYNDCTDTTFQEFGYPWTQLGYTYDWSPNSKNNIGLSEFVIKREATIYVRGKYNTGAYCQNSN